MKCVLVLISTLLSITANAQTCDPLREYDEIIATVTDQFYDRSFNGLDWNARASAHRRDVDCEDSAGDVAKIANSLLSELNASHTAVYTESDLDYWGLNSLFHFSDLVAYRINFPGVWPERRDEAWYARIVLEGSAAERAGVLMGDELIAIDDAEFDPLGFPESIAKLTVSSDGSRERSIPIQAERQSVVGAFVDASRKSAELLEVGEKRVGYFHLWTARDRILEAMNQALSDFEALRVDAVVIDYRGGYGGTSEEYLASLTTSAYLSRVPKYFLIDDTVRSGKELLAGIVKRDRIGTLVGSVTAGYYLGGRMNRLFDGKYFLYVAVGGGDAPGIGRIEGVGIQPDVSVPPCRSFCSGRDPQLEKALELIAG